MINKAVWISDGNSESERQNTLNILFLEGWTVKMISPQNATSKVYAGVMYILEKNPGH
jgi:hypothetical protein